MQERQRQLLDSKLEARIRVSCTARLSQGNSAAPQAAGRGSQVQACPCCWQDCWLDFLVIAGHCYCWGGLPHGGGMVGSRGGVWGGGGSGYW